MFAGILGSTGFIGSYLCRHIAAYSQRPLRLLIRNTMRRPAVHSAEVLAGDLLSRADCEHFVTGLDVIYYLAHINTPINSDQDRPTDVALNLVPFLNLLDAIRKLGAKPHIVYFSSGGAVYAPRAGGVAYKESDPCHPRSSYGILKIAAEQYLRIAAEHRELTATVLRVGNAYGTLLPEYRMQGLIGVALNQLLHGNAVHVFGNSANVRDYVHLEDVCIAARKAAARHSDFDIINVGTGQGHSVNEILAIIRDCHGAPFPIRTDATCGQWLMDWVVLDCSRAKNELDWSPTIELSAGIAGMMSALRGELDQKSLSVP